MDYIIKDGWIVNGKKEKPFYGDLVIKNGKVAEVGTHIEIPGDFPKENILNAAGGYITPGFIDIHRHGDWQAFGNGDDQPSEQAGTDDCGKWKLWAFGGSGRRKVRERNRGISQ